MQDNGLPDPARAVRPAPGGVWHPANRTARADCGVAAGRASALSAEQILASLRAAGARVSKATVYNTLNLFAERGVIRQLSVDGARTWFDSNVAPHYHFHDMDTGALMDVPGSGGRIRPPAHSAGGHGNGGH
ncbi:MAG: transcriptional repressor [Steroidobacteraceae bacterium]